MHGRRQDIYLSTRVTLIRHVAAACPLRACRHCVRRIVAGPAAVLSLAVGLHITLSGPLFSQDGAPLLDNARVRSLVAVLEEPMPLEHELEARDAVARRQAEAAVVLLRGGHERFVWPLLLETSDNSRRTYLTHLVGKSAIEPESLIRRLHTERNPSARRALILALGSVSGEQLPHARRQELVGSLVRWYREDSDPGTHGAIDWLLRHSRRGQAARHFDWQQAEVLQRIDRELAGKAPGRRNWYVTREGSTMTIVRGPAEFSMGAPAYELPNKPGPDSADEPLHRARIPRSFAIGTKEVTVGEFRRFLEANPDVRQRHTYPNNPDRMARVLATFSPEDEGPQIAVTWYEAAMYCNWLSKQDGLPRTEWVYPEDPAAFQDGMPLPNDYLKRRGYRLPTEAEWEYAARAGSVTSRFYGSSEEMLDQYAWYSKKPPQTKDDRPDPADPQRTWPVGQLKPNDLGLFDVYGNVWEWTQDRLRDYPSADVPRVDVEDDVLRVTDTQARVRRGGGFPYGAAFMRSAHRGPTTTFPTNRRDNVGFRVARTYR